MLILCAAPQSGSKPLVPRALSSCSHSRMYSLSGSPSGRRREDSMWRNHPLGSSVSSHRMRALTAPAIVSYHQFSLYVTPPVRPRERRHFPYVIARTYSDVPSSRSRMQRWSWSDRSFIAGHRSGRSDRRISWRCVAHGARHRSHAVRERGYATACAWVFR